MKLQTLLYPAQTLDHDLDFFQRGLGLPLRFRDGDRYAVLSAGDLTIGIATGDERLSTQPAAVFRVDDIAQSVALLLAAGATLLRPAQRGPHEWRALLATPGGHHLILSAKLH
jgi:predicted enzyme related to lactoylglutathione lyase